MFNRYAGSCPECGGDLILTNQYPEGAILADAYCDACNRQFERIAAHTLDTEVTEAVWRLTVEDRYENEYSDEEERMLVEMTFHELREEARAMYSPAEFEEWQKLILGDDDDQEPLLKIAL